MADRPRDPNQLAKMIVATAVGVEIDTVSSAKRDPASVRGRAGGKGGLARAAKLSVAGRATRKRWTNNKTAR